MLVSPIFLDQSIRQVIALRLVLVWASYDVFKVSINFFHPTTVLKLVLLSSAMHGVVEYEEVLYNYEVSGTCTTLAGTWTTGSRPCTEPVVHLQRFWILDSQPCIVLLL